MARIVAAGEEKNRAGLLFVCRMFMGHALTPGLCDDY
jgi:hypothetical protein